MPNMVDKFVSSTYLAITSQVYTAVGCVLARMFKIFGLYTHSICWLPDLNSNLAVMFV